MKQKFGSENINRGRSLNSLACLYLETGQYRKAKPLLLLAHEIVEKVVGRDHPTTITIRSNYQELIRIEGNKDCT